MHRPTPHRLITIGLLLGGLAALPLSTSCGKGGSGDSSDSSASTTGTVQTPDGQVAWMQPGLLDRIEGWLLGEPAYAAVSGLTPVGAGIDVELIEVDLTGAQVGVALATTQTLADGSYNFPGITPATNQSVVVKNSSGAVVLRALVSSGSTDVDPVSQFLFDQTIAALATAGATSFDDVSLTERASVAAQARQVLDVDFTGLNDLGTALTAVQNDPGAAQVTDAVNTASEPGNTTTALSGDYGFVAAGVALGDNFFSGFSEVDTRGFDGNGILEATTQSNTIPFFSMTGGTLATVSNGTEGSPLAQGTYIEQSNGTFVATRGNDSARGAFDKTGVAGQFAVVLEEIDDNATDGSRGLGFLVKQGQNLSAATVSGTYNWVAYEMNASASTLGSIGLTGTMTFDGSGNVTGGGFQNQEAVLNYSGASVTTATESATNTTGTYTVAADGALTITAVGGAPPTQEGFASIDGSLLVTSFDATSGSGHGLFVALRQPDTAPTVAGLDGSYTFLNWQVEQDDLGSAPELAASADIGSVTLSNGALTGTLDFSEIRLFGGGGNSVAQTIQSGTDALSGVTITGAVQTAGQLGQLTHDLNDGLSTAVTLNAMVSADGGLVVIPNGSFEIKGNDEIHIRGMLVLIRQ